MTEPLVSVVVPTRGRPHRLARLLEALRQQDLGTDRFEVIVVADGASEPTHELVAREAERGGLELRVVSHPVPRGPAAARNAGWLCARAPVIAFTDDDCRPEPGWLSAGLTAARPLVIVQGPTGPDPEESDAASPLSRSLTVEAPGTAYETCNIFYPRRVLEELGGFDEAYGLTPGGEDTDLGWRALKSGFLTAFVPEARVHHAVERLGAAGMLRVAARWSGPMRVFAEHPEARSVLYRRVFWNVWHYLVWRSAAAILAPSWLRRMVLMLHLVELRRRARIAGGGTSAVPFLLVHDVVECWAVARGALRYRVLVL